MAGIGVNDEPQPLTDANAQLALHQAGSRGNVISTSHFKMRAAQRKFTTPEALHVVRKGVIEGKPEYCQEHGNWKYILSGQHDRGRLYIVAALKLPDGQDLSVCDVVLITGFIR